MFQANAWEMEMCVEVPKVKSQLWKIQHSSTKVHTTQLQRYVLWYLCLETTRNSKPCDRILQCSYVTIIHHAAWNGISNNRDKMLVDIDLMSQVHYAFTCALSISQPLSETGSTNILILQLGKLPPRECRSQPMKPLSGRIKRAVWLLSTQFSTPRLTSKPRQVSQPAVELPFLHQHHSCMALWRG